MGIMLREKDKEKYSERAFWKKVEKYARKAGEAGRAFLEKALCLYYAAQSPEVPLWAKTVIYSALGYFINPIDAIPDFTPVAGFTDDLGALATAILIVAVYITPKVKKQAAKKVSEWFD